MLNGVDAEYIDMVRLDEISDPHMQGPDDVQGFGIEVGHAVG